ncbi:MAG TPA: RNA ligase family protein [Planctomycetota bacterium]|nr:RNA ligase family protein [Planctomycetota bacterium]
MSEYHKIDSVFKRDPATKHKTMLFGQFSRPEFEYLADRPWVWTEKVDGTNVRVMLNAGAVSFGGRTDAAQMPVPLSEYLRATFTNERVAGCFEPGTDAVLYGEGYGAKIQKGGGRYLADRVGFILFDVRVGRWWLVREAVEEIAAKLAVPVVPIVGRGTLAEAVEFARVGFKSRAADDATLDAEGLVMRPSVELSDRGGHRIITKIKARDFDEGAPPK